MTDKTERDALVARIRMHARDCVRAADMDTDVVLSSAQIDDMADAFNQAAEALAAPAEGASAEDYERELSAVMPEDFKDWHQNDKREWPAVAAAVIRNLREREAMAWEQAASVDVDSIMEVVKKYTSNHSVLNPLIRCDLTKLIDSAGGAKGEPVPPCACFDHADAICPEHRRLLAAAPAAPKGGVDWPAVAEVVREFVDDYQMMGEDEQGREGIYTPNEREKMLILDAVHGLLSDSDFTAAFAAPKGGLPDEVGD